MITFSGFETTFSLFTNTFFDFSLKQNSLVFMYAGLIGLVVQGYISRRSFTQFKRLSIFGMGLLAAAFVGLAVSQTVFQLMLFLGLLSVAVSFVNTFLPSLLSMHTTDDNKGIVMGSYEAVGSISRVLGPLLAYSVSFQLLRQEYLLFAITCLVSAVFLLFFLKSVKQ